MWLEYIILGVVQGLTEFLPVSSSGHLVLGQELLGVQSNQSILFEVTVHVATLLAVFVVFWARIKRLAAFPFQRGGGPLMKRDEARWWLHVLAGTFVTGVIGLTFKDQLESLYDKPLVVAGMLAVTGAIIFGTKFAARGDGTRLVLAPLWIGAAIGLAQALAITPGISRSGMTIAAALYLGMQRDDAGEFSFLLAIPAILGAALLHAKDLSGIDGAEIGPLMAAFVAAFAVGLIALKVLLRFVRQGRLHYFAWYCWAVSGMAMVWLGVR